MLASNDVSAFTHRCTGATTYSHRKYQQQQNVCISGSILNDVFFSVPCYTNFRLPILTDRRNESSSNIRTPNITVCGALVYLMLMQSNHRKAEYLNRDIQRKILNLQRKTTTRQKKRKRKEKRSKILNQNV